VTASRPPTAQPAFPTHREPHLMPAWHRCIHMHARRSVDAVAKWLRPVSWQWFINHLGDEVMKVFRVN
jgi:hypothetical protein